MNNKDKQYVAGLEHRILVLENTLEHMVNGIHIGKGFGTFCSQCNVSEPVKTNHICNMEDCCQGLNPNE